MYLWVFCIKTKNADPGELSGCSLGHGRTTQRLRSSIQGRWGATCSPQVQKCPGMDIPTASRTLLSSQGVQNVAGCRCGFCSQAWTLGLFFTRFLGKRPWKVRAEKAECGAGGRFRGWARLLEPTRGLWPPLAALHSSQVQKSDFKEKLCTLPGNSVACDGGLRPFSSGAEIILEHLEGNLLFGWSRASLLLLAIQTWGHGFRSETKVLRRESFKVWFYVFRMCRGWQGTCAGTWLGCGELVAEQGGGGLQPLAPRWVTPLCNLHCTVEGRVSQVSSSKWAS